MAEVESTLHARSDQGPSSSETTREHPLRERAITMAALCLVFCMPLGFVVLWYELRRGGQRVPLELKLGLAILIAAYLWLMFAPEGAEMSSHGAP